MILDDWTHEQLLDLVKSYVPNDLWNLHDFDLIIKRGKYNPEYNDVTFCFLYADILVDGTTGEYIDALPKLPENLERL